MQIWLTILVKLAGARAPHQRHRLGEMCDDWFRPLESSGVASHHDGELSVLGTRLTSRYRRIEEIETALFASEESSRATFARLSYGRRRSRPWAIF